MRHKGKPWEQEGLTVLQQTLRYQKLSVGDLAKGAELPVSTVARVVGGTTPTLTTAIRIARFLKVSMEDLWGGV
jgi:predicted transcriptional regulator